VNPHASEVISQKVIERVPGKKTETIRDPVGFIARIIKVWLSPFSEISNGFGTLFIGARPNA
jgi:hypothetical protein